MIGYIDLIENKIPQRSYTCELNAALHLSLCFHMIDRAHDRSSQKRALSEQIFRYALWNKGEKIISLIEEAVVRASFKDLRSSHFMPLTRDTCNNMIESVASKSLSDESDIDRRGLELPAGPYAFELIVYEQEHRRFRVFSLIYGINAHKRALDQWRIEYLSIVGALCATILWR